MAWMPPSSHTGLESHNRFTAFQCNEDEDMGYDADMESLNGSDSGCQDGASRSRHCTTEEASQEDTHTRGHSTIVTSTGNRFVVAVRVPKKATSHNTGIPPYPSLNDIFAAEAALSRPRGHSSPSIPTGEDASSSSLKYQELAVEAATPSSGAPLVASSLGDDSSRTQDDIEMQVDTDGGFVPGSPPWDDDGLEDTTGRPSIGSNIDNPFVIDDSSDEKEDRVHKFHTFKNENAAAKLGDEKVEADTLQTYQNAYDGKPSLSLDEHIDKALHAFTQMPGTFFKDGILRIIRTHESLQSFATRVKRQATASARKLLPKTQWTKKDVDECCLRVTHNTPAGNYLLVFWPKVETLPLDVALYTGKSVEMDSRKKGHEHCGKILSGGCPLVMDFMKAKAHTLIQVCLVNHPTDVFSTDEIDLCELLFTYITNSFGAEKKNKAVSTYSKMQLVIEFRVAAEKAADRCGGVRLALPPHAGLNMMWQGRSHSAFFVRGVLQLEEKKVYQLSKRWLLRKPNYGEIVITPELQITCFSRRKHSQYSYLLGKPVRVICEVQPGGHPHAWAGLPNVARYKNGNDLAIRIEWDEDGSTKGAWIKAMQLTWHQNHGQITPLHLDVAETMMSLLEVGLEHAIRKVRLIEEDPIDPDRKWVPEPKDVVRRGRRVMKIFEITPEMRNELPLPCADDDKHELEDDSG